MQQLNWCAVDELVVLCGAFDHSEARNDQGRRVKQEFKMNVMKLLRFGLPKIMFFLPFVRKGDF